MNARKRKNAHADLAKQQLIAPSGVDLKPTREDAGLMARGPAGSETKSAGLAGEHAKSGIRGGSRAEATTSSRPGPTVIEIEVERVLKAQIRGFLQRGRVAVVLEQTGDRSIALKPVLGIEVPLPSIKRVSPLFGKGRFERHLPAALAEALKRDSQTTWLVLNFGGSGEPERGRGGQSGRFRGQVRKRERSTDGRAPFSDRARAALPLGLPG